jgi:hypothetical protein
VLAAESSSPDEKEAQRQRLARSTIEQRINAPPFAVVASKSGICLSSNRLCCSLATTVTSFFLFWSSAAKKSEWVLKELHYAMARNGGDEEKPSEILPVIIEGPPPVDPPPELAALHFNDRMIYFMQPARDNWFSRRRRRGS